MQFGRSRIGAAALCLFASVTLGATTTAATNVPAKAMWPFEENGGRYPANVAYAGRVQSGRVFVTTDGKVVHSLRSNENDRGWSLVEVLEGASAPMSGTPSPAVISRFHGSRAERLQAFESLRFEGRGLTSELRLRDGGMERLFELAPGTSADRIRVRLDGAESLAVSADGALRIGTGVGDLQLSAPIAWQMAGAKKVPVDVAYRVRGKSYTFTLGRYDAKRTVYIDPLLRATYVGGTGSEGTFDVVAGVDRLYACGGTNGGFPGTSGGAQPARAPGVDVYVAMFSFDLSTLMGATYYGGNGDDFAPSLSVAADSIYIGGQTTSTDLPGRTGGAFPAFAGGTEPDAFVARLSLDLTTILRASYFGGTERDQADGVEVTPAAVYLAGYTSSVIPGTTGAAQPSLAGSSDGFVARFSPDLTSLVRATYLGGTQGDGVSGDPSATADSLYVAGTTDSHDFPNTAGGLMPALNAIDSSHAGYVTRLSLDLTENVQSTYYARDFGHISVFTVEAALGDVFIMGRGQGSGLPGTAGGAQPTHGGGFSDLFIARLAPTLTSVVNATYFGGSKDEEPGTNALLISGGHVFVGGHSTSATLPGIAGAAQETKGGPTDDYADAFIARFSADLATLDQSTWFGGSAHESGSALTAGPTGIIYLAGGQPGTQLPGTSGAAITSFAGGDGDGFIAAFTPDLAIAASTPSVTISDFSAAEGNGGSTIFTFLVSLSEPPTSNVSVQVQTVAGTATALSDFLPLLPFTLTFTPFGPTTRQVTVQVAGDFNDEPNEQFTVVLSNPNGVTIADNSGLGTIINDDAAGGGVGVPTLSIGALAALACALGLAAVFAMRS